MTNTHHTQLKAWSTQSDLSTEGQTATPLSSGVNQTQMLSAACSSLSSSPRSYTGTPTAEGRTAQSVTHDPSWLTRMSDHFSITASGVCHVMFNLVSKSHTRKLLPRLTCWLLCSCYAMRGFSFQWDMRDIIPHCKMCVFLNMRNKILHIHGKRVFSHKMINICIKANDMIFKLKAKKVNACCWPASSHDFRASLSRVTLPNTSRGTGSIRVSTFSFLLLLELAIAFLKKPLTSWKSIPCRSRISSACSSGLSSCQNCRRWDWAASANFGASPFALGSMIKDEFDFFWCCCWARLQQNYILTGWHITGDHSAHRLNGNTSHKLLT